MRILITGGYGLVGGRLAAHMSQGGHEILLGSRKAKASCSWLPDTVNVETRWENQRDLEKICDGVEIVIHAAGMNGQDCYADPVGALEFNGVATARLVSAAINQKVKRFVYLSSAHVYSSRLVGIFNEQTCPRNLHPYATSHLAGEKVVLNANNNGCINGLVLRLSNSFGKPMHKHVNCWMLLINSLCLQAIRDKKLKLNSSGLEQRDFIPLSEACRIIGSLSVRPLESKMPPIINLGTGVSTSVMQMTSLIQKRFFSKYNQEIAIDRVKPTSGFSSESFQFQTKQLDKLGYKVDQNPNGEIDALLNFCERAFKLDSSKSRK